MRLEVYIHPDGSTRAILNRIVAGQETIMAAIDDLRVKFNEINASLDNAQADITAILANANGLAAVIAAIVP